MFQKAPLILIDGSEAAILNTEEIGEEAMLEVEELAANNISSPIKKGGAAANNKLKLASFMAMAFGGSRGLISIAQAIVAKDMIIFRLLITLHTIA